MNIKRLLAGLMACLLLLSAAAAETVSSVTDWYFAGTTINGEYLTAEELGSFMHLQLRENGVAANISQNGEEMKGTWRQEDEKIIITFGGVDGVFTEQDGQLIMTVGNNDVMCYTHQVAGIYVQGSTIKAENISDFDGTWDVKWIWNNGVCQSIEYLRRQFGMDSITVELENGTLKTEEADFGMVFSEGMLYFSTNGNVVLLLGLQENGMLCYADRANNIAYYCKKIQ